MPQRLFLNTRALTPAAASVRGATSLLPQKFPAIVAGNKIAYRFFAVDGFGNYEIFTGDPAYGLKLAIGDLQTRVTLVSQTAASQVNETIDGVATSAWEMILNTNVAAVLNYVAGQPSKSAWIELQITDPAGNITTICQQAIEIRNRILA